MLRKLWNDECGASYTVELILVMTLVVLASVVGLSKLGLAINNELLDVSSAIGAIDQSFQYPGYSTTHGCDCASFDGGSGFEDGQDVCDCAAITSDTITKAAKANGTGDETDP